MVWHIDELKVPEPYVSVIVTAHNRRQYLPQALQSLENQIIDKDKFEVIVVKNFEDAESDRVIKRNGWKDVVVGLKPLGEKLIVGLSEAKARVITFLEDDDLYAPERLAEVHKAFSEDDHLSYLHNEQTVIDERGNILGPHLPIGENLTLHIKAEEKGLMAKELFRLSAFHNLSSIAVDRELAESSKGLIIKAEGSADLALFAAALKEGQDLLITTRRLTLWRVHGQATSPHGTSSYTREDLARLARAYVRWALAAREVYEYLRGTPYEDIALTLYLFRKFEASAMPSWALGAAESYERLESPSLGELRELLRLHRSGFIESRALIAALVADLLASKAPSALRWPYWRLRAALRRLVSY